MLWNKLLQMWHWTGLEQTISEKILFARNTCIYVKNTCFTACSWKTPVRDLHTELASLLTRVIRVYKLHFHIYGHCCACMSKLPVFRSRPVRRPGAQFNVNKKVAYCSSVRKHVPPMGLCGFGLAHPRVHAVAQWKTVWRILSSYYMYDNLYVICIVSRACMSMCNVISGMCQKVTVEAVLSICINRSQL